MTPELNPEVQRALATLSAVLERGFRARVARSSGTRRCPWWRSPKSWRSPGPAFIGTCLRQKATNPDTGVAPPPAFPAARRGERGARALGGRHPAVARPGSAPADWKHSQSYERRACSSPVPST